ncbi:MAG: IS3 family transposase [Firmicutes bacterium]|nr:IS3 family transposase [Bacillota bacterium]
MRTRYPAEFKKEIVNLYENGTTAKQLSTKYNLSKSILYDWIKLYKKRTDKNSNVSTYQEVLLAQKKLAAVQRELEILKKTKCFPNSPRKEKLKAIESLYGQYPVKEMCRTIDLPHGTFYNYHFRRVLETRNEKKKADYRKIIKGIFDESGQRFGSIKIYNKMRIEGFNIDVKTVSALFKEIGLKSKQCKKRYFVPKPGRAFNFIGNKLNRQFNPTEPNKFWVSDTTHIWIGNSHFWLCVIIELFSRKIIAYRLSSQDNAKLIINTFKDAFENRGHPSDLTFHSDKGSGYISNEFRSLLCSLKVTQSCSKTGNPYDNAVVEAFFSNMKREELNFHNFEYFDDLKECIVKYMEYYNGYRPHNSLKNKTPNQIEQEFFDRELLSD